MASQIGIVIGSNSIKIVELLRLANGGFEILNFALRNFSDVSAQPEDRSAEISRIIREVFAESRIRNKDVFLPVSGSNVVIRDIQLPKMPESDLLDALKWQLKEEVLFPIEDAAIDWHILREVDVDGAPFFQMLVAVVRHDVIPELVGIVKQAGLKLRGVNVVPLALQEYDRALNPYEPGLVTCFVDMGARRTRVYFTCDDRILFTREIPNGGRNITKSILGHYEVDGQTFSLTEKEAEEIKYAIGLPDENVLEKTPQGIPHAEIRERLIVALNKQAEEIYRSIEYFKNREKKDTVHRLILSGGASGLKGLYQYFGETLEIPTERCNIFVQSGKPVPGVSDEDIQSIGPSLTAAAGAALVQGDKINLLPEIYRTSIRKTLLKLAPYSLIPILIFALVFFSMDKREQVQQVQDEILLKKQTLVQLQAKFEESKVPMETLKDAEAERDLLKEELVELPGRIRNAVNLPEVLEELSRLVPRNTSLSRVEFFLAGGSSGFNEVREFADFASLVSLELKGDIFDNGPDALDALTRFLGQLKQSPVFYDVKLIDSTAMEADIYNKPGIQFIITARPTVQKGVAS